MRKEEILLFRCSFRGLTNINQYEELIKVFVDKDDYEICHVDDESCRLFEYSGDGDLLKRDIYESLASYTGNRPKWGILTGIRPVKLAGELYDLYRDYDKVERILSERYLLHHDKIDLVEDILRYQLETAGKAEPGSLGIYIGIPFCPTRCLYCSFTSNQADRKEIDRYLEALCREIKYCGRRVREGNYRIESIYIGGGTPTSLDELQMEILLDTVENNFDLGDLKEFTVEAGRPDTFTEEKLNIMKKHRVNRISINPQTMHDATLEIIGRSHTVEQTEKAFEMAELSGIECINTDLIAGLPGESVEDFQESIKKIVEAGADNITLHTLAVKRASRLKEIDAGFNYRNADICESMLRYAHEYLRKNGYRPYYLYRQKHTSGDTENVGFCRNGKISLYNIRIMQETQSVLAIGAGGISKVYFPAENRLERVANVSNYQIYIDRIDEMIERKENNFWR